MKKVYKYPTGAEIPEGAIYLSTVVQLEEEHPPLNRTYSKSWEKCWYVWHYFLVEVSEN